MDLATTDLTQRTAKYKSVMNILRRAFSFRNRRDENSSSFTDTSRTCSIEMTNYTGIDALSASPMSSEVASTSRDSLSFGFEAPSVYEDPFVAVTADGIVHVKYYYDFNPRAEFRPEDIHLPHVKKLARSLKISRLRAVHYSTYEDTQSSEVCKPWGLARNDVWWASHVNRQLSVNQYFCVVLDDGGSIRAGCSVVCLEAFLQCLRCLGMDEHCSILPGLPTPPLSRCKIPFIDEDVDEEHASSA